MEERDEIVRDFLAVTHEDLDQLDQDLVELEGGPERLDLLGRVLLAVGAVRRTSAALRLPQLEALSRAGEDLLSRLHDRGLAVVPEVLSGLLDLVEALRSLLRTIEQTGHEGTADHGVLLARLAALPPASAGRGRAPAPVPAAPDDDRLGELLVAAGAAHADDVVVAVLEQEIAGDARRLGDILLDQGAVAPDDLDDVLRVQAEGRGAVAARPADVTDTLGGAPAAPSAAPVPTGTPGTGTPGTGTPGTGTGGTKELVDGAGAGPLLLVGLGPDRRAALPLPLVTRVADVAAGALVRVGSREVVPYRGGVLPLTRLSGPAAGLGAGPGALLHVVVCSRGGRSVGLVVDEVLAVVAGPVVVRPCAEPGLLGATVLHGRVTELLDVHAAVLAADPGFFDAPPAPGAGRPGR